MSIYPLPSLSLPPPTGPHHTSTPLHHHTTPHDNAFDCGGDLCLGDGDCGNGGVVRSCSSYIISYISNTNNSRTRSQRENSRPPLGLPLVTTSRPKWLPSAGGHQTTRLVYPLPMISTSTEFSHRIPEQHQEPPRIFSRILRRHRTGERLTRPLPSSQLQTGDVFEASCGARAADPKASTRRPDSWTTRHHTAVGRTAKFPTGMTRNWRAGTPR